MKSSTRSVTTIGISVVVVVAAVVIGVTAFSGSSLPVLAANFRCVPEPLIPQLKPGESGTMTTSYGGFTATFRSTLPRHIRGRFLEAGMPLKGTLTMTQGGQSWTLPRPANVTGELVNVMCVIAFQRERDPGVMLEGFSGGAHCCEAPVIYLFNHATDRYVKVVDMSPLHFKDPLRFDPNEGFIPKIVGHHVLIQSGDGNFAFAFACYACSVLPYVLDAVGDAGLTDVTAQHQALLAANARATWKYALEAVKAETSPDGTIPLPFGFVAPWVADECVLGRGASAWATTLILGTEGKLSNALFYKATMQHGSFIAKLHAFLLRNDYCHGQI